MSEHSLLVLLGANVSTSHVDIFIGLNVIRALTMIALILVFASNILTMVDDVKAVNAFESSVKASDTTLANATANCDYIE